MVATDRTRAPNLRATLSRLVIWTRLYRCDGQEAFDHWVDLLGHLELVEVPCADRLSDSDGRVGLEQEVRGVGRYCRSDHEYWDMALAQNSDRVERGHCLDHRDGDVVGYWAHGLDDLGASVGVVGGEEHLLDELAAAVRSIGPLERRYELRGEPLPYCSTGEVDHHYGADQLGCLT